MHLGIHESNQEEKKTSIIIFRGETTESLHHFDLQWETKEYIKYRKDVC